LYFVREGELWVSDGTSAGTQLAVEINVFRCCQVVGNAMFFTAADDIHGYEMWRMDADGGNPRMVANLNTQPVGNGQDYSSDPVFMFRRGDSLIFTASVPGPASNGNAPECRMYRADASGTGVIELANFGSVCAGNTNINLPRGGLFVVSKPDGSATPDLWVTDGTPAGTVPMDLGMYFSGDDGSNSVKAAYGPNGEAYFFARAPVVGANLPPDKVWVTDGTRAGTRVFADLTTYSRYREIAWLDGRVYFDAGWGSHPLGDELWTSDGTPSGTFLVRDVNIVVDSIITNLRTVNGKLQFFATGVGAGLELWSSDGTFDGTINLITTNVGSAGNADSNPVFAGRVGSRVVFTADRGSGNEGHELMISDGTGAGTSVVRGLFAGGPSDPDNFLLMGEQILFVGSNTQRVRGLWRTDGTSAGTIPLAVLPGETSNILLGDAGSIIDGVAYFTAAPTGPFGTLSYRELWRTDGTSSGTFRVPGNVGQRVNILGGTGSHLLYQALSGGSMHLWSWDGSQARIIAAADGLNISSSVGVTVAGRVCFRAWDVSSQNVDVWCANGLAGDLMRATNFVSGGLSSGELYALGAKLLINVPGSGASTGLYVSQGSAATTERISGERIVSAKPYGNQQLVYTSDSRRLILTDGTSGGTRNLLQGATLPGNLTGAFGVLGTYIVFVVDDANRGAVLWRTDGTAAGTRYLADVDSRTTPAQAGVGQFFTLGDRLLFSAHQTRIGNELWAINATDPNASDDAATATGGTALMLNVLENDADFDRTVNAATVTLVAQPAHGVATVNATTGAISYTATTSYSGTDTLTYRVSDDQGRQSNVATVTFQVTAGSGGSTPPPTTPPPSGGGSSGGGGGGGGSLGFELWALLSIATGAGWRRRRLLRHS
jgi:ELWxxDGT repeat protein